MKPASEVIKPFVSQHPEMEFAITINTLGARLDPNKPFTAFAQLTLTGKWVFMPFEILVNSQSIQRNWIPINK